MTKLVKLEIYNFRTIQNLQMEFDPKENLVCLIGRGDSGKTTILDAISIVLSPLWNITFNDSDFYNCNFSSPLQIIAHLIDPPETLLKENKFGLFISGYNIENSIITHDIIDIEWDDLTHPLISIKIIVDKFMEPKWFVINHRTKEEKVISSNERAQLNCFLVSDYIDRHFSWNKGNPLYSLLNSQSETTEIEESNIVLDSLRLAKNKIDEYGFSELQGMTDKIKDTAASLGLDLKNTKSTIDFKELSSKEGKISLHEDKIPFRLKGKGSKRLASLAIQMTLSKGQGLILVDEIEQGLEPDRIKQLIRTLKDQKQGQIFLTTHSRDVITELGANPLQLILKNQENTKVESRGLKFDASVLTGLVRACPEAFFAKKVIVCEGATEVGICRGLDLYRKSIGLEQMSFKNCAYIDGGGNNLILRAKNIRKVDIETAILCDSDATTVNSQKEEFRDLGISVFDCAGENCIEQQVFLDLNWDGVKQLLQYVLATHKNNDITALSDSVKSQYHHTENFPEDWIDTDSFELRKAMALASTKEGKEWFKRIDHGEYLGTIIFKNFDLIDRKSNLKTNLLALSEWIDK